MESKGTFQENRTFQLLKPIRHLNNKVLYEVTNDTD